jgi:hypothetical protein
MARNATVARAGHTHTFVIVMAGEWKGERADLERAGLLARTAARIPQLRLTHFVLLSLGLRDLKGAAAHVLRLIHFVVRQNFFS